MLLNFGRMFLVLILLTNPRQNVVSQGHGPTAPAPVKVRYYPLSLLHRQQILASIETPPSIDADLPLMNLASLPAELGKHVPELSVSRVPNGNPLYLLMSLRW
jgi:hypothetical protein